MGIIKDPFRKLRRHEYIHDIEEEKSKAKTRRKTKSRSRARRREEEAAQRAFVEWARARGLEVQHQNNGAPTKEARIRLHAMGCTAGAADLLIFDRLPMAPEARGLAIEFKASDGTQSPPQRGWESRIEKLGWRYHVARSSQEAIEICRNYGLAS